MKKHHFVEWTTTVLREKLKDWEKIGKSSTSAGSPVGNNWPQEPFTMEGFLERLLRWVVVDDQVITEIFEIINGANSVLVSLSMLSRIRNFANFYYISVRTSKILTSPIAQSSQKQFLMLLNGKWYLLPKRCR